jgi:hypothetical protein
VNWFLEVTLFCTSFNGVFLVYKLDSNKTFNSLKSLQWIEGKHDGDLFLNPKPNWWTPFRDWSNLKCFFNQILVKRWEPFFGESARIMYTMIVHYIRSYHEDSQRTCMYGGAQAPPPPLGEWMNCIDPRATGVFEGGMGHLLIDSVQIHLQQ